MEQLAEAFGGAFNVTSTPNSTAAVHPRLSLYKMKLDKNSQEKRRSVHLENQKRKRRDFANHARCLAEGDWKVLEADEVLTEETDVVDEMDCSTSKKTRRKKERNYYKDQLMMSEWLVDIPIDLSMEWTMVLCPAGKRTLVIASRGTTVVYNKAGYILNRFPSLLPGGAKRTYNDKYTILDCIYSEVTRTFFVLDLMCWNGHPIYDSETEFRFYWMHTKFSEVPKLAEKSKINPFLFIPLPSYSCERSALEDTMCNPPPFQVPIDGVLFYHKRTHYFLGSTPLVGWLKPWMIPDMLGVPVSEVIKASKPPNAKMRPPSPNAMDTEGAKNKRAEGTKNTNIKQHRTSERRGGKGDRKSGRNSMDMDDPIGQSKSPVYRFETTEKPGHEQSIGNGQKNVDSSKEKQKEECMDDTV